MKLTIYKSVRDPDAHHKILRKDTLRVVNVHDTFAGIGKDNAINTAEFKDLAQFLEPSGDSFDVTG